MTPSERVEAGIRETLRTMRQGQPLPSVRVLAEQYKVSTATVTKAVKRLKESGEVQSRPGWGVFKA
jgi:DNA-binding transcriptional regulator YhcF (GntR family)